MSPFFTHNGTTYSLADIISIEGIKEAKNQTEFVINLSNGRTIIIHYFNDEGHEKHKLFCENHYEKVSKMREALKTLWGEFKKSIPNLG